MTKRDLKFYSVAKAVSKTSTYGKILIGAIIVYKREIISVGANCRKTHPLQMPYDRYRDSSVDWCHHYLHAEMNAIIHADKEYLPNSDIYIFREDRNGKIANCRPCEACMNMIKDVGIKKIYYTTRDGFCVEELGRNEV